MSDNGFVTLEKVCKKYGDFTALDEVSFSINKGEIVGFLGPNGAGKTTTMKIITGYIPPTKGSVTIDGMNIFSNSLECRRKIGYLPEDVPLYDDMKVTSYLKYVCKLRDIKKEDIAFNIDRMVKECDLEKVKDKLIKQLSKGNRQRVGLAQALIHEPEILILDEPTVGLDPKQVVNIRNLISRLRKDHTVILSTHILSEVEQMCDRVIIINEGKIAVDTDFTKEKTSDRFAAAINGPGDDIESFLKDKNIFVESAHGEGNTGVYTVTLNSDFSSSDLAKAVIGKGWALEEMKRLSESLEAMFLKATMKKDQNHDES